MSSHVVFPNVRLQGRLGSLSLSEKEVIFEEKSALRTSKSEWCLEAVKEDVIKPVTSSVDLKLELDGDKDTLSFKMISLAEVVRFRRVLADKLKDYKEQKALREGEATPEALCSIPERTEIKATEQDSPASTPPPAVKAGTSKPSSPDETEATMSMSGRTHTSERSRPGAVRVEGSGSDRGSVKARRQPLTSSTASAVDDIDKRIAAKVSASTTNRTEPPTSSSVSDETPPSDDFPVRDVLSDDTDDVSEFADDDMPDDSGHSAGMNASSLSHSRGTHYGRRRETLVAPVTDRAKDLLTPTDHQRSLNESLHSSLHIPTTSTRSRRGDTIVESVSDQTKMNSSVRSSTSRKSTARGLRGSDRRESVATNALRDSVASHEPPQLSARERQTSKLSSSVSSVSDSSAHRLSRARRDSTLSQGRVLAQACAKEYKKVLAEKNLMKADEDNNTNQTSSTPVVSAEQRKLNNFAVGRMSMAQHAISEKSAEWKSAEFSLKSEESGGRGRSSGQSAADPYNIGLIEARVVEESGEFLRPSAVASAVDLEEEETQRKKLLYRFGCCCCLALIVVIILAVLAATDVLGGGGGRGTTYVAAPVLTPEERYALIQERISNVVYDLRSLEDVNNPQRIALEWLVNEDKFHKDIVEIDDTLQEKLEQRYTLAVFYYSMAQASPWQHCRPPETGEVMACVHPVLESYANEGVYFDQKMSEPAFRWLSNTDECSWAGVKCTDGLHVSKLQLAGYDLQGTLPIQVGFLRSLEVLDLQQNGLKGTLPVEWGALETDNSALQSLRLDQNLLTGPIPVEWCDLNSASLKNIVLSNNHLSGTIPECLSKFAELENFSVLNNQLSGTIPDMGTLLHLKTFHAAGNNMHGDFPETLCNLERYEMKEASADCKNTLSENFVECPCCTTCCDGDNKEDCSLQLDMLGEENP